MGLLPNPSRETKFSGVNGDREIFVFPVQLITSRIGNPIRLIHTLDWLHYTVTRNESAIDRPIIDPRILLGMVEARSVKCEENTNKTTSQSRS